MEISGCFREQDQIREQDQKLGQKLKPMNLFAILGSPVLEETLPSKQDLRSQFIVL